MIVPMITVSEEEAYEAYIKASKFGDNPIIDSRDGQTPIGLKVCSCVQSSEARVLILL